MSSDVVGSRCQEVGSMKGNGVVSITFCAPEGVSLGVHVPVHEVRGVGVKQKQVACMRFGQTVCIRALSGE